MQGHCNYTVAICLGAYGIMVSTTLGRSAIHAADHLPDLELGPYAAGAAHRWDHPEDRAAVQEVDRLEVAQEDRAEGPARAPAHLGFGPQKHPSLLPVTKNNTPADRSFRSGGAIRS
jgi:hypothetical protein